MKKWVRRILTVSLSAVGALLILIVLVVLLIRLPSVQNFITHKVVAFVSDKTHTRLKLHRLYIGFPKLVVIEGLYSEDLQHDTLLNVQKLEVDINMLALLNKKVEINSVALTGATAHIYRNTDSIFNFNFFIT